MDTNISIPKVAMCSKARSGSSMMMAILEAGGLIVDKEQEPEPIILELMRNPYGLKENRQNILSNNFHNSFKLLDHTKFSMLPSDYKIIYLNRPVAECLASWNDVISRFAEKGAIMNPVCLTNCTNSHNSWNNILLTTPSYLTIQYNLLFSDTTNEIKKIATFLNTQNFIFNETLAANAIDKNLYINRG